MRSVFCLPSLVQKIYRELNYLVLTWFKSQVQEAASRGSYGVLVTLMSPS